MAESTNGSNSVVPISIARNRHRATPERKPRKVKPSEDHVDSITRIEGSVSKHLRRSCLDEVICKPVDLAAKRFQRILEINRSREIKASEASSFYGPLVETLDNGSNKQGVNLDVFKAAYFYTCFNRGVNYILNLMLAGRVRYLIDHEDLEESINAALNTTSYHPCVVRPIIKHLKRGEFTDDSYYDHIQPFRIAGGLALGATASYVSAEGMPTFADISEEGIARTLTRAQIIGCVTAIKTNKPEPVQFRELGLALPYNRDQLAQYGRHVSVDYTAE